MPHSDSPNGTSTPTTYVGIDSEEAKLRPRYDTEQTPPATLAPELALTLAAVLLAAAEQVSGEKLERFGVNRADELTLHGLAMAFRDDDSGLAGDVFEWALLLAINSGDPAVTTLVADALTLAKVPFDQPQAVLVAAEPGRLVAFSPDLPEGASLATGRRGRPPHLSNLLRDATSSSWKADLVLGSGDRWVGASLKSNPHALSRSLYAALETPHPPRIGITASHKPAVVRDPNSGAVLVHVPVHAPTMLLSKLVLSEVTRAFRRHLSVPSAPMQQDVTGIGVQLDRWRDRTVHYVVTTLMDYAGRDPLAQTAPTGTGASVLDARGALVVLNTLVPGSGWSYTAAPVFAAVQQTRRMSDFEPID